MTSRRSKLAGLAAAALLAVAAPAIANAQQLEFTYTEPDGQTFGAILDGTLAGDGNHFIVSGYESFFINGTAVAFTPTIFESYATFADLTGYSGNSSGTVTLDGSYLDLIAYSPDYPGEGFDLVVNDLVFAIQDVGTFGAFLGEGDKTYVQADWSASLLGVPEPATLAAFCTGLCALAMIRRRRA